MTTSPIPICAVDAPRLTETVEHKVGGDLAICAVVLTRRSHHGGCVPRDCHDLKRNMAFGRWGYGESRTAMKTFTALVVMAVTLALLAAPAAAQLGGKRGQAGGGDDKADKKRRQGVRQPRSGPTRPRSSEFPTPRKNMTRGAGWYRRIRARSRNRNKAGARRRLNRSRIRADQG